MTLAVHLDDLETRDGVPVPIRAEAWVLDALALDALAEHEAAARSLDRALDLAEPVGLRRIVVTHGSAIGPLLRRQVRHGTAHPAIVGSSWSRSSAAAARRGARPPTPWPSR